MLADREGRIWLSCPKLLFTLFSSTLIFLGASNALPGTEYDYGAHPKFVCTPIPADADPSCFPVGGNPGGAGPGVNANEEAKTTILHLRESLVRQKETILDQRETIRELTAKLTLCEGFGRGMGGHDDHHDNHGGDKHGAEMASSPEQMGRMLQALKERLENLQQSRNTSSSYSNSLKDLLQRKIHALEQQMNLHSNILLTRILFPKGSRKKPKSPDAFQIGFPMRTNYMYGRIKRTLLHEIFALTLCLWLKGGAGPGLGTPFSYSVPGQANELVLIEWGNNPMELLVNDKAVTLPLSLSDGKWHHLCVSWSTRDGLWEAYQDGVKRGSGENLSAWHPIKPGGVFILGQEQDTLGGRFDATQAFVGEISDLQLWSHMLTSHEIYNLATCGSHMTGDIIAWTESAVELHGGVTKYPFDPCH
uniref:Si:dkey-14o18.2 n=1 Tax=Scleropages formosus TaxID=113540 RepID=A0A8C9S7W0_SCLFO